MLSNRLRRVIVAVPSYLQRSCSLSRTSEFASVSSLLPLAPVRQSREYGRPPSAKLFSTTQYQYDPYTGEDSFTPDNEGCDFNHWLITMHFPKDNLPSREEMISSFEQTCAKGFGISLEEAKKKIYAICTTSYQGFQAKMSIGEVEKFRDLPGVQYIIPDSYVDVENKMYGGDKYDNGVITPGPIPAPTREGFDSLQKKSRPGHEKAQEPETRLDQRSFKHGHGTLALGQEQGQRIQMLVPDEGQGQGSQIPVPRQGQGQGQGQTQESRMPSFQGSLKQQSQGMPIHGQGKAQGSAMPSIQGRFNQGQGIPVHGLGKALGTEMPSFQGRFNQGQGIPIHGQGKPQGSDLPSFQGRFNPGQQTATPRQGQAQGSQMSSYHMGYNQSLGTPINAQKQGQGSQIPSYEVGYSQGQGAQTPPCQELPNNYGQATVVNYSQASPLGNFVQGTQENYNQMGLGNHTQQSGGNYDPAKGAGSPGFGHGYLEHGQGRGSPSLSPYQGSYNQGQATSLPGQGQGTSLPGQGQGTPLSGQGQGIPLPGQGIEGPVPSYQLNYSQGLGAPVPPYQVTPGIYGQWASVNYNQGPPHANIPQGPQQNYNQGQWNYCPRNSGHYGPTQFVQGYPGPPQGQGVQMPQYQLSYQGHGTIFPGQCRCQGCGMPLYQWSYNQGQGTPYPGQWLGQAYAVPSYQASYSHSQGSPAPPYYGQYIQGTPGNYGRGTSVNFNQGFPENQVNYNMPNSGYDGPTHRSARQEFPGHRQNQTFSQDQRNVAGDWSNNNSANPTEARKPNSRT